MPGAWNGLDLGCFCHEKVRLPSLKLTTLLSSIQGSNLTLFDPNTSTESESTGPSRRESKYTLSAVEDTKLKKTTARLTAAKAQSDYIAQSCTDLNRRKDNLIKCSKEQLSTHNVRSLQLSVLSRATPEDACVG